MERVGCFEGGTKPCRAGAEWAGPTLWWTTEQTSSLTAARDCSPGSRVTASLFSPICSRKETPWAEPLCWAEPPWWAEPWELLLLAASCLPLDSRGHSVVGGLGDWVGGAAVGSGGEGLLLLSVDIGKKNKEKKKKKEDEEGPQVPGHMVTLTLCGGWGNHKDHSENMKTLW